MVASPAVTTGPRYQHLPALSTHDRQRLRDSIERYGVLIPVRVDEDGRIIDGHHRAEICAELGVVCPTEVVTGLTLEEKRYQAHALNVARRHLTIEQKREAISAWLKEQPTVSDRKVAEAMAVSPTTVGNQRRDLEAAEEIPVAVDRPHARQDQAAARTVRDTVASVQGEQSAYGVDPDDDDPEGDEREVMEDVADHRRMSWVEVTINYAAPSDVERARMNARLGAHLPYPRDSERREWPSKRFYLTTPPPRSAAEVEPMLVEIHQQLRSRIMERPLRTMMREG